MVAIPGGISFPVVYQDHDKPLGKWITGNLRKLTHDLRHFAGLIYHELYYLPLHFGQSARCLVWRDLPLELRNERAGEIPIFVFGGCYCKDVVVWVRQSGVRPC